MEKEIDMRLEGVCLMLKAVVILLLACCLACAVQEIDDASLHNMAMAGSLMGAGNPCSMPEREPTQADIFSAAGMKIISAIPQAGNVTTDLGDPKLLWTWFAKVPSSASFTFSTGNGCPDSQIELYNPSGLRLEGGRLAYSYGSMDKEIGLSSTGPNPAPLDLGQSHLRDADFSLAYANLSLEMSGEVGVDYLFRKMDYTMNCQQGPRGSSCNCTMRTSMGTMQYHKPVSDSAMLDVETGPVQEVWLNPPLGTGLDGNGIGKVLLLSRRMPSKISVASDGRVIALDRPYLFSSSQGQCGETDVSASFSPVGAGLFVYRGEGPVFPPQLVDKNASYYPIYAEFDWNGAAGAKAVQIGYEDWFSDTQNFTRDFSAGEPSAFYGNRSPAIMGAPQGAAPAAYQGGFLAGGIPDLSPVAIPVSAILIIGAYGVFSWLRREE